MKKPILQTAFALAALLAGTTVFAEPYIGVSAGRSDVQVDCTGASACDTTDAAYKIFGGYMFNPHIGIEGALFDLGKASGSVAVPGFGSASVKGRVRGLGVYGVAALPVDQFAVFAKAGIAYTNAKLEVTAPGFGASDDTWKFAPVVGVGASYAFTPQIGARIEWERLRVEYPGGQKENADLISAGVTYRF